MRHSTIVCCMLVAACSVGVPTSTHAQSSPETEPSVEPLESEDAAETSGGTSSSNTDDLRTTRRLLQYGTLASLGLTAVGGVITYVNLPTQTGDGLCETGDPLFGSYGCDGFNTLHGIAGVSTALLYTVSATLELVPPDRPADDEVRLFDDPATAVHLGGMAVLPLMGIVSNSPEVLGIDADRTDDFPRTMRTLHASVAVVTAGAYLVSWFLD